MSSQKMLSDDFGAFLESSIAASKTLQQDVCEAELHLHIASEVYRLRTERGMTQSEFADLIGTQQSVIARLEDAEYTGHSVKTLNKIAMACGRRLEVNFCVRSQPQSYSLSVDCSEWPSTVPTMV